MVRIRNLSVIRRLTMLRLVTFAVSRETVLVLRYLLHKALKGELRGLALCYWSAEGRTRVFLTGPYRAQPVNALGAADLIKIAAGRQLDLFA